MSSPQTAQNYEERMRLALISCLCSDETPTCAAQKWGLNRITLLYRLLREKKLRKAAPASASSAKMFQSKFTSNQLLSAQQEEHLADYLKQRYEMQCQYMNCNPNDRNNEKPPLLTEKVARNLTYIFVRMNRMNYPISWDANQQATFDWFNGYVDRNPEIIEYVVPSDKVRKKHRRHRPNSTGNRLNFTPPQAPNANTITQVLAVNQHSEETTTLPVTLTNFKSEPLDVDWDSYNNNNVHQYIVTTKNDDKYSPSVSAAKNGSIADNVKCRTERKSRMLSQHSDDDIQTKTNPNQSYADKASSVHSARSFKRQFMETETPAHQQSQDEQVPLTPPSLINCHWDETMTLKASIEQMNADVNYLLNSMLMELTENNRLLRRLIADNESKNN